MHINKDSYLYQGIQIMKGEYDGGLLPDSVTESKSSESKSNNYILPGAGAQAGNNDKSSPLQTSPLLRYYSPRLLGAPPQLTSQCDMRLLSSDGDNPGPVGDFYLTNILQDSVIANFCIGRARFIGGMSSLSNIIRECYYYGKALAQYDIFDSHNKVVDKSQARDTIAREATLDAYKESYGTRDSEEYKTGKSSEIFGSDNDIDSNSTVLDISGILQSKKMLSAISSLSMSASTFLTAIKTSLSVQQPFYTFEDDWTGYINNVKMMINTAVIMLGLQSSSVRIGDTLYPIGMDVKVKDDNDVWANYRYITPTTGLGDVNQKQEFNGNTSQYISFACEVGDLSENYNNTYGESQLFSSVIKAGDSTGAEIAFITNATSGSSSDMTVKLAKDSKAAAEEVLKNLSSGNGRFTAAIASSMARSYIGEHSIYPDVYQSSSSTSGISLTIHLQSHGDIYSYLTDICVPTFYALGMVLPQLSNNNASAYTYPPIIQCNIPGLWGTRLGAVESLTISKNSNSLSIHGFPTEVTLSMTIRDLHHVLHTSPMNKPSTFLNNQPMFDYIAQMSGVDRYRVNGSMRTIARLALGASATSPENAFHNIGDALLNDWHSLTNKIMKYDRQ